MIGDLFYSQLLYPGLRDAGVPDERIMLALTNYGPALTGLVVSRMHASAPDGVVVHIHDPVGWWGGHTQPFTLDHVLAVASRSADDALALLQTASGPEGTNPRSALVGARDPDPPHVVLALAVRSRHRLPGLRDRRRGRRPGCVRAGEVLGQRHLRCTLFAMRWLAIAALLVLTPAAAPPGPGCTSDRRRSRAITAVAAQGNSLFGLAQNGDIWRADAGSAWVRRSTRPRTGTSILVASPGALYVASTDPNILSRSTNGARTSSVRPRRAAARHQLRGRDGERAGRRRPRPPPRALVEPVPHLARPGSSGRIRTIARNGTTWFAIVERPDLARPSASGCSRRPISAAPGACAPTARR